MLPTLPVHLDQSPGERWQGLAPHARQAAELTDSYLKDLGGIGALASLVTEYRDAFVPGEYAEEVDAIAGIIGRSSEEVLVANLYYDAMRAVLGCTAFGIDTPSGPIHARNLDWWTSNGMLSDYTLVLEVSGGRCPGPYRAVGWPGFIGVFSAVAEGRFAVTLNAVLSAETPRLAESITLLLRSVFDTAPDYDAAMERLRDTPIAADCLLLITGTRPGQMAVVERTSTKAAVRYPEDGLIVVTNDYRGMHSGFEPVAANELQATACARFDRASSVARRIRPSSPSDCFGILRDPQIQMDITVQHMVMQASTGLLQVELPRR